jgi:antitoxin component YwqK of YwqJK toxin-antitoxin module
MQQLTLLVLVLLVGTCSSGDGTKTLPALQVVNYDPSLQKTDTGWFYKKQLFSGFMVEIEKDGRLVYQLPILCGNESGLAKGWYNTGEKLLERPFVAGKKEGLFKQWWPNGRYRYLFQYKNDLYEGVQLVFFPNGKKREESHYKNGEKEGIQRVWDEKGQLVSHYTIKNKHLYGLVTVKSCIPAADF